MDENSSNLLRLFLCGDVMTGRGIDQVLPYRGNPELHEPYLRDARDYVRLAENANGSIACPVAFDYIWGDAFDEFRRSSPDVRIINLETSITRSDDFWPDKGINYRMHPSNIGCITAAKIDCCCLANNHVLDWGYAGLDETLRSLDAAAIQHAGAGQNAAAAALPAVIEIADKGRVLVFSFGSTTSGVPVEWGATADRPGVNLLENLSERTAVQIAQTMQRVANPGDVLIASIHWGSNWGYEVPHDQVRFARCLAEAGIPIVHGHSSHHLRPIEIHHDCLILYGCGDFINDYEGIAGYATYRDDLRVMVFVTIDAQRGGVVEVRLVPMQVRNFRLNHASRADAMDLCELVNRLGSPARLEERAVVLTSLE